MKVLSVNVGRSKLLDTGVRVVDSGIVKRAVGGRIEVRQEGLYGDEQADTNVHGGISKAVYAYPREHYEHWQRMRAQASAQAWEDELPFGALGENLTIEGLLEAQAYIGDVLRFPDCQLAISEPRTPCFKFNAVMGFSQASQMMVQSGWCGFYLAVRDGGTIGAGESFEVVPGPRHIGIAEQFRSVTRRSVR